MVYTVVRVGNQVLVHVIHMKFKKSFLLDLDEFDPEQVVLTECIGKSRWSLRYRQVFKHEDKFYETYFSCGATEHQDESPYEYESDEIECKEVRRVEKVVVVYE